MPHGTTPAQQGTTTTRASAPYELVVAADPVGRANPRLAAAAHRSGGTGLVDVADATELAHVRAELERRRAGGVWIRPGKELLGATTDTAADVAPEEFPVVVLDACTLADLGQDVGTALEQWQAEGRRVLVQVVSREQALSAVDAGCSGLVAVGCEAGGRVGDTQSFVLLQQCLDLEVDVWLRGGAGLHTSAAVIAGGGRGVVLDTQLGLLREADLPDATRTALAAMDGSETRVVAGHRIFTRPDLAAAQVEEDTPVAEVAARLGADLTDDLVPLGQDSGVAAAWAARFVTVGGAVRAVLDGIESHLADALRHDPLAPGAGVSAAHRTRYPIAQGPMTRVSDRADFAVAVTEGGGLPFLALALLPGHEVRDLLVETAEKMAGRPWGVGLLGFAPAELLAEQLAVVHEVAPPFALVAGGRPSQSAALEEAGIGSYLHVPSPGLLDRFLADGARSFVFEGRECGGHVGPRSSFALWEAQVERLLEVDDPQNLRVLLAGGIHDARSAAMAAAVLAPLAARGAQVGVLMGTAYLFTAEAVSGGAVLETFQDVAVDCERTVLVETAPGHATRCVETQFVRDFAARKAELEAAGVEAKERWAELEQLNLGRLRIASKGLVRGADGLTEANTAQQLTEGMYMIGEVATLRDEVTTVGELHASVSVGSVGWLHEHHDPDTATQRVEVTEPEPFDIAVVGMESFLPGAVGAEQFWANVLAGTDHVTEVPAERWDTSLYFDADTYDKRGTNEGAGHTTPSKWGGFIEAVGFDPLAYGIPPASLAAIEPVQLLALEVAARALADAGYASRPFDRERASVVFGAESGNELGGAYGIRAFLPQVFGEVPDAFQEWLPTLTEDSFPGVLANVIAGRIANRLDLGGVNYTVDAACGSSLAALDAACKELRQGSSDLVIAGGADLHNGLNDYLMFSSVHALSPSGRCRTFDANADGIALGEGIAAVVLKRRVDAERDGDRIYAIIDAVAGSSDGRHLGLTAPRKEGQQRAVARAVEAAGVDLREVGLVEAHGTGTVVGDRTEMATLTELFAEADVEPGSVVLGSVKSQIGHTKCAAGLAGLIKVAKSIHHGVLPPTINLVEANPYHDAATSPFRFHDKARPWAAETRRAGVSAFGFGGTNFHAVLSSYDAGDRPAHGVEQWPAELFLVRGVDEAAAARTVTELQRAVAGVLESDPGAQRHRLRDLARTVSTSGRGPVRAAFVAASFAELASRLDEAVAAGFAAPTAPGASDGSDASDGSAGAAPRVAFLYPGQGSQRPGMLSDLFVTFGGLDDVVRAAEPWASELFPAKAFTREERAAQQAAITATDVAQPTLGVAGIVMTRLLRRVGVTPHAAAGHSYGELPALAAAGAFDETTLLRLSAARGRAVLAAVDASGGDPGTMAAVALTVEQVRERLADWPDVVVANHNAPTQVVVSGPTASVRAAVEAWEADGVRATLIPVACAFHSPLVATASSLLAETLADVEIGDLAFPVWSNTTAAPYPVGDADAVKELLAAQVSDGVRFVDQVESMYAAGVRVFVEAGPGRVLSGQVAKILGERPHTVVATDITGEPGVRRFLEALAELASVGVEIDAAPLFTERAETVDVKSWPVKRPGWTIDGAFVRRADGTVLPNSFQPSGTMPSLDLAPRGAAALVEGAPMAPSQQVPGAPAAETAFDDVQSAPALVGTGADAVVTEYLRSMRQVVAAERDVLLRYLGASPSAGAVSGAVSGAVAAPVAAPVAVPAVPVAAVPVAAPAVVAAAPVAESVVVPAAAPAMDLMLAVQEVVSERTGYPVDMLEPDLDLEADLSIDSIKRIEIVGELADKVGLAADGDLADDVVEELSRHKTLRAIVTWIENQLGTPAAPATAPAAAAPVAAAGVPAEPAEASQDEPVQALPTRLYEVSLEALGPAVPLGSLDGSSVALVVGNPGLTDAVETALGERGAQVARLACDQADEHSDLLAGVDVVVDLSTTSGDPRLDARDVFATLRPALLGSVQRVLAVGVTAHAADDATGAAVPTGLPGLFRSLAREREDLLARAVEVEIADLDTDVTPLAVSLVDELLDLDAPADVSWAGGTRTTRVAGPEHTLTERVAELGLDAESVVVLTGGARGITARIAEGIARTTPCRLVLVGRSPFPTDAEDPRLADARTPMDLRRAVLEAGRADGITRTPAEVEKEVNGVIAAREVIATLAGLRDLGADAEYVEMDVRSPGFGALLDALHSTFGRLDGVIHGAGVLDDRLVRDKTLDGFDRVFGTKVEGARAVLDRQHLGMRFVVLFGSVSGVFGNKGQVDYAAANDALDTLARIHDGRHGCHVVSLDWGPWAGGGMVSPELEREYARRGVGLLDPTDGVTALLNEVAQAGGPSQLVVMSGSPEAFAPVVAGRARRAEADASSRAGAAVAPTVIQQRQEA